MPSSCPRIADRAALLMSARSARTSARSSSVELPLAVPGPKRRRQEEQYRRAGQKREAGE